jgi:hypothetical protein
VDDPQSKTRSNAPTRNKPRSKCWDNTSGLCDDHPKSMEGLTHICSVPGCGHFNRLQSPTGRINLRTTVSSPTWRRLTSMDPELYSLRLKSKPRSVQFSNRISFIYNPIALLALSHFRPFAWNPRALQPSRLSPPCSQPRSCLLLPHLWPHCPQAYSSAYPHALTSLAAMPTTHIVFIWSRAYMARLEH